MVEIADISVRNNRSVPSDLMQIWTVARYDVFKHLRSRRFFGILAILILVLVAFMAIPPIMGQDYNDDSRAFAADLIAWVPIVIVLAATLFGGDAIVSEFQGRTGYLLFPNPVKRWVLFAGKYLSAFGLAAVIMLVYYGIVALLALVITGGLSWAMLASLGFSLLFAAATMALAFLFSSLLKGATGALILTFASLFLIFPSISSVFSLTGMKPYMFLDFVGGYVPYSGVEYYVMLDPYPLDTSMTIGNGSQAMTFWTYYPDVALAAVVMVVYTVVCLALGYILFRRREMVS